MSGAARVLERCDALAQISEEPGRLTRRFGTEAMREANELVAGWMREAGLETREDAVRNLIGRRGEGPFLMLGSHLDTVVDAGRYDGPLGVLIAIEAAERVARDLEVVGFADEEGCRFGTAYLGSSALTGRFDAAWLEPARRRRAPPRAAWATPARPARTSRATSRSTSSRARCSSGSASRWASSPPSTARATPR